MRHNGHVRVEHRPQTPEFDKGRALLEEFAERLESMGQQMIGLADCVRRMAEGFEQP